MKNDIQMSLLISLLKEWKLYCKCYQRMFFILGFRSWWIMYKGFSPPFLIYQFQMIEPPFSNCAGTSWAAACHLCSSALSHQDDMQWASLGDVENLWHFIQFKIFSINCISSQDSAACLSVIKKIMKRLRAWWYNLRFQPSIGTTFVVRGLTQTLSYCELLNMRFLHL